MKHSKLAEEVLLLHVCAIRETAEARWLENTFANGDGVAGQNAKAGRAFGEPFGVHSQNLVTGTCFATDADPVRRRDTRVSAGKCDGFEQVNSAGTTLRHFETAR